MRFCTFDDILNPFTFIRILILKGAGNTRSTPSKPQKVVVESISLLL